MKIQKFNEAFKKLLGTSKKTVEIEVEFIVTEHNWDRKLYNIRISIPGLVANDQYFIATGITKNDIEKEKEKFLDSISSVKKAADKYNI